jgi:hypothetical protein
MNDKGAPRRAGERGKLVGAFERQHINQEVAIPVSLEQVLLRAASDLEFRAALLEDREAALETWSIELRPSERSTLEAMPRAALETMIVRIDPQKQKNSAFARTVATAVAGSMIMFTATGCLCGGISPDDDFDASADADEDTAEADDDAG